MSGSTAPAIRGSCARNELCLEARIIAVADFYGALTEERPYRHGIPHEEAIAVLMKEHAALDVTCIQAIARTRQANAQRPPHDDTKPPRKSSLGNSFLPIAMPN